MIPLCVYNLVIIYKYKKTFKISVAGECFICYYVDQEVYNHIILPGLHNDPIVYNLVIINIYIYKNFLRNL